MSKYIIEFKDKPSYQEDNADFYTCKQIPWWSVNKTYIDKLTPIDKELDEAYQRGYKDCETRYCSFDACPNRQAEYKRGLEDGKAQSENGCVGCRYESRTSEENPCVDCSKNFENHWTAKQTDEIKVGDEMKQVTESGTETGLRCAITAIDGDCMSGISQDGRAIVCSSQVNRWWKKTGRHFDIEKILEEMME